MSRPLRIGEAIDLFLGDLARQGRKKGTLIDYRYKLNRLADELRDGYVDEITREDYERFLNRWVGAAPSTLAGSVSLVHVFSKFLWERGLAADVGRPIPRPRKQRPEDLDVVTVSSQEVRRMLDSCESWQEFICLASATYLGARRRALAAVRLSDVDFEAGTIRLIEKGGKVQTKPLPDEYVSILRAAQVAGVWKSADSYLIPNRRPGGVKTSERSDKVIWETVKKAARRADVPEAHVHSLRAAFAVQFDDANPDQLIALKELMGHTRIETTLVYLRRKDKAKAMEVVRTLSWGAAGDFVFPPREEAARKKAPISRSFLGEAHTGFEPVPPP